GWAWWGGGPWLVLRQDPRDPEPLLLYGGCLAQDGFRVQARHQRVLAEHVDQRNRVRGGRDAVRGDLLDPGHRGDDHVKLRGQVIQFILGQGEPGEPGEVCDVVTSDWHGCNPRVRAPARRPVNRRVPAGPAPPP